MPRYSAPGAIRRCHIPPLQFTEPVSTYRRRAPAARLAGNRRAPSCPSRVITPKLARPRSPRFAGRGPTVGLLQAAASGAALQRHRPRPQLIELSYDFYLPLMQKDAVYAYGWFKPPASPLPDGATALGRLLHLLGR
jgi:hypothetical protein